MNVFLTPKRFPIDDLSSEMFENVCGFMFSFPLGVFFPASWQRICSLRFLLAWMIKSGERGDSMLALSVRRGVGGRLLPDI